MLIEPLALVFAAPLAPAARISSMPMLMSMPMRRLCAAAVVRADAVRLETPSNPAECVSDSGFYST